MDLSEIPETGVRLDQVMEVGVYYYFHLPMEQQPDYLTFTQQFGGSDAPVPSVMDLILLQKGARLDFSRSDWSTLTSLDRIGLGKSAAQ